MIKTPQSLVAVRMKVLFSVVGTYIIKSKGKLNNEGIVSEIMIDNRNICLKAKEGKTTFQNKRKTL
ncbi:hypothetical protein BABA_13125 [Neobacillus bataviensis LMG 21833]|uniref:Uncharacterized protein n=1 Tax=Neobacillus bataviensis LMG 21833 TaxID=1117379 RepID=K6DG69_9BACI|nr:hypothetical protein BABA_13125 [Neobacillus bataviensis LMG 21833]